MTRVWADTPPLRIDMNTRHPNTPAAIDDHAPIAGLTATAEREPGAMRDGSCAIIRPGAPRVRISMGVRTC